MARPSLSTALTVLYVLIVGQTLQACASSESASWSLDYNQNLEDFDDLEWGEWSRCSRNCGSGSQTRRRVCRPGMDDLACNILMRLRRGRADFTETRLCNTERCALGVDEGFDGLEWGEWTQCSRTCGVGSRVRRRACTDPNMDRQTCRHLMSIIDRTDLIERQSCLERTCEVRGHWGPWSAWQPCSSTCGPSTSFQVRNRPCFDIATENEMRMWSSSSIPGEYCETLTEREIRPCDHLPACPQPEGDRTDSPTTQHTNIMTNGPDGYSSFVSVDEYDNIIIDHAEVPTDETDSSSWADN